MGLLARAGRRRRRDQVGLEEPVLSFKSGHEAKVVGRLGGLAKSAQHDGQEGTLAARGGFLARFLDEVDPLLPEAERLRRAEVSLRIYMTKLALRSAKVRREKRERQDRPQR